MTKHEEPDEAVSTQESFIMKKNTRADQVYNLIIQKVINERLFPGTPLREDHLAAEFGVSSTPVREAFRKLEQNGWLQSKPYCGSCIRHFTIEEIEELYQLREADECLAIRLASDRVTEKEMKDIRDSLDAEDEYIRDSEKKGIYSPTFLTDLDFHRAIVRASHSEALIFRNDAFAPQIKLMNLSIEMSTTLEQLRMESEEHKLIYQAFKRHWVDSAVSLLKNHLVEACHKHISTLKARLQDRSKKA